MLKKLLGILIQSAFKVHEVFCFNNTLLAIEHITKIHDLFEFYHIESYLSKMKKINKSLVSKKRSCFSFNNASCKDESSLELMRISLRKELDRKQRLQELLQKYESIRGAQKQHIKTIKASVIELKDMEAVPKIHFLVDPNIYVDNNLSIQSRQFLCMLLNTFYQRYEENKTYQSEAVNIHENVKNLIKNISSNQQLLLKVQKANINTQMQMEGYLLNEKNKLKHEIQKTQQFQVEEKRVQVVWVDKKRVYDEQKGKVEGLVKIMKDIQSKIAGLTQRISKGEEIRQGNQEKISDQMVYQLKFDQEINIIRFSTAAELQRQVNLKKRIKQKKIKLDKAKGINNYDNSKHEIQLKLLELQQHRSLTKLYGLGELIYIQKQFGKARISSTQKVQFYSCSD